MDRETYDISQGSKFSHHHKYAILILILLIAGYFVYKCLKTKKVRTVPSVKQTDAPSQSALLRTYAASWCGATQQFLPVWDRFREELSKSRPDIKTETIMCDSEDASVCEKAGINAYPTIILYKADGSKTNFEGSRTILNLHEFIRLNTEPVKY